MGSTANDVTCVLDARAQLGECPVWSLPEQALYWVDIHAPAMYRLDPATGATRDWPMTYLTGPMRVPGARFNDGKVSPDGRFWAGTMDEESLSRPIATLYRLDPDGSAHPMVEQLIVSNGLAWSADGATM